MCRALFVGITTQTDVSLCLDGSFIVLYAKP